jgi:hypothetical protein
MLVSCFVFISAERVYAQDSDKKDGRSFFGKIFNSKKNKDSSSGPVYVDPKTNQATSTNDYEPPPRSRVYNPNSRRSKGKSTFREQMEQTRLINQQNAQIAQAARASAAARYMEEYDKSLRRQRAKAMKRASTQKDRGSSRKKIDKTRVEMTGGKTVIRGGSSPIFIPKR